MRRDRRGSLVLAGCLALLAAVTTYSLGRATCGPTCMLSIDSGTATVTFPTGTAPNCTSLTKGSAYTFSSDHSVNINKTGGDGVSCNLTWTAQLSTNESSHNLNASGSSDSWMNGTCTVVTFRQSLSPSFSPPATGTFTATAATKQGSTTEATDQTCYTAN